MKKKEWNVVLLLIFSITPIYAASCGDVNGDEAIDIVDALLIAQDYVSLDPANFDSTVADVNGDNTIDIVDALLVAQYYVELIDTLDGCESTEPCKYEMQAEDTIPIWEDTTVDNDNPGYTGSGYVNTANTIGRWIEWSFDVAAATHAFCEFRYACATDDRSMDLSVNGSTIDSLSFPASGSWTSWIIEEATVSLIAGTNTIRLTSTTSGGAPNMDKMDITLEKCNMVTPTPVSTPAPTQVPTTTPEGMTPGPAGQMLPPNGAIQTSADITLGIIFEGTPKLNGSGKLQLRDSSGSVVETFTSADPVSRVVAGKTYQVNPIQIINNTIYFLPKNHLKYGETYSVTVDNGMVSDDKGNQFSADGNDWRFTVRGSKPPQSSTYLVASDGSGDYCTIQGALDDLPSNSSTTRTLNIKNGGYPGLVVVEKNNIRFQGTDRFQTILANKNSAQMAPSRKNVDRMAYLITANDITFDSLTLWNTFPYDDTVERQAEAIVVNKNAKRIFINNSEVKSFQDTIMVDTGGQLYIKKSRIWGDVHYVWGYGTIYCENSELTTHKGGSSITVARNGADTLGFAFVNCKITREESSLMSTLGDTHGFDDGNVAFINCQIGDHIIGWENVSKRDWEYGNTKLSDGSPVTFNGIQLSDGDPNLAKTASAQSWLGWAP